MTTIIGLSGSLRRASYNTALLQSAVSLMPNGTTLNVRTIHGIPLYNGDEEDLHGPPDAVKELKAAIAAADGLLLATPEYNGSIPGTFKNAIDWLSRPADDIPRVFGAKPVALLGASSGRFGTILSQNAWLPVLSFFGTKPWFGGRFMLANARDVFDGTGRLIDMTQQARLREYLAGFVLFIEANRS